MQSRFVVKSINKKLTVVRTDSDPKIIKYGCVVPPGASSSDLGLYILWSSFSQSPLGPGREKDQINSLQDWFDLKIAVSSPAPKLKAYSLIRWWVIKRTSSAPSIGGRERGGITSDKKESLCPFQQCDSVLPDPTPNFCIPVPDPKMPIVNKSC